MGLCARRSMVLVVLCITYAMGIELCGVESGTVRLHDSELRYRCTPTSNCEPRHVMLHYASDESASSSELGHCFIWRREIEAECALCASTCCWMSGGRRGTPIGCVDYLTFFNFTEVNEGVWKRESLGKVTLIVRTEGRGNSDVYVELLNFCAFCNQIVRIESDGAVSFFGLCSLDAVRGSGCPAGEYWSNGRCEEPKRI